MKINGKEIATPEDLYKEYSASHVTMLWLTTITFAFVASVLLIYPTALAPFSLLSLWYIKGDPSNWVMVIFGLSTWATITNLMLNAPLLLLSKEKPSEVEANFIRKRVDCLIQEYKNCIIGPPLEEILFRWLIFFVFLIVVKLVNWLLLGFLGVAGIPELFFTYVGGPVADCLTFGYLSPYLLDSSMWAVGLAMVSANIRFMEGHSYQGCFGLVNSWYMGMVLFWIMFTYGIPIAILGHVVYNLSVYTLLFFLRGHRARLL